MTPVGFGSEEGYLSSLQRCVTLENKGICWKERTWWNKARESKLCKDRLNLAANWEKRLKSKRFRSRECKGSQVHIDKLAESKSRSHRQAFEILSSGRFHGGHDCHRGWRVQRREMSGMETEKSAIGTPFLDLGLCQWNTIPTPGLACHRTE